MIEILAVCQVQLQLGFLEGNFSSSTQALLPLDCVLDADHFLMFPAGEHPSASSHPTLCRLASTSSPLSPAAHTTLQRLSPRSLQLLWVYLVSSLSVPTPIISPQHPLLPSRTWHHIDLISFLLLWPHLLGYCTASSILLLSLVYLLSTSSSLLFFIFSLHLDNFISSLDVSSVSCDRLLSPAQNPPCSFRSENTMACLTSAWIYQSSSKTHAQTNLFFCLSSLSP